MDGKDYDLKLLSVHHNGVNDYLDDEVADMDKASITKSIWTSWSMLVVWTQILWAHFDYGFACLTTVDELKAYEEQLKRIFPENDC